MSAARLSPVRCAASSSTCLADSLSLIRVCRRMPDCCADQTLGKVLGVCVVDSFREQGTVGFASMVLVWGIPWLILDLFTPPPTLTPSHAACLTRRHARTPQRRSVVSLRRWLLAAASEGTRKCHTHTSKTRQKPAPSAHTARQQAAGPTSLACVRTFGKSGCSDTTRCRLMPTHLE